MFKRILLSFAILGFLFASPLITNAASFTSLKNQLFELTQRIESFNTDLLGQAGGANSSYDITFTTSATQVVSGETINLEFKAIGATSCTKSSSPSSQYWTGTNYPNGNGVGGAAYGLPVTQNTTFSVTCTWPGGITKTASVSVAVSSDVILKASPTQILAGGETKLEWKIPPVPACTKSSVPEHPQWKYPQNFGVSSGVSTISNITQTTTFFINCVYDAVTIKTAIARVVVNTPDITFTSSATEVVSGDKINLEFKAIGATSCTKLSTPSNPSWTGISYPKNSTTEFVYYGVYGLPVTQNTTFFVTCTWPGGITKTAEITVTVSNPLSLKASPTQISAGGGTQLEWDFSTATSCTKLSVPEHVQWKGSTFGNKKGSLSVGNITKTTTFSMTCTWPGGITKTASVTVFVPSSTPHIIFTATPSEISYLGSTTLNWEVFNMPLFSLSPYACNASGDWSGNKGLVGSQVISGIKYDKNFVLECVNPSTGKKESATAKVKVKGDEPVLQTPVSTPTDSSSNGLSSCTFVFNKNLSYGSLDSKTSKDVSLMQSVLVDEGFLSSKDATGKFYNVTKTALIKFQKKHNLKQTGIADANTRVKLNELYKTYCAN